MKTLLSWTLLAFLFAFLFSFACGGDDDDDAVDDDSDDDDSDDDTIDDDTVDDDDPFWPPPPLDLDPYQDDGQRLGILCGEKVFLLTGDAWQKTEQEHFDRCFALDENTFFLKKGGIGDIYRLENGVLEQIGHLYSKEKTYFSDFPFVFYRRDLGFFREFKYTGEQWLDLPIAEYDLIGPDDAVAVENDHCLAHWNGSETETIVCLDDHPVYEQFSPDILPLYIAGIQYNALDDIWVAMTYGGYSPLVFTHWDGADWDKTQIVYEGGQGDFRINLDWDFADAQHGWATVVVHVSYYSPVYTSTLLLRYSDGVWTQIEKPQPPLPENYLEYGYESANDQCYDISMCASNEVWLFCERHYGHYEKSFERLQNYLLQLLEDDYYFWAFAEDSDNQVYVDFHLKKVNKQ